MTETRKDKKTDTGRQKKPAAGHDPRRQAKTKGEAKASPSKDEVKAQKKEDTARSRYNNELAHTVRLPFYYMNLAARLWMIMLYSIPLDAVLLTEFFSMGPSRSLARVLEYCLAILAVVAILGLNREQLFGMVSGFHRVRRKASESTMSAYVLAGIVVAVMVIELLMNFGRIGLMPVLIAAVAVVTGLPALRRNIRDMLERSREYSQSPLRQLAEVDGQTFYVQLAPMICARLISLTGALLAMHSGQSLTVFAAAAATSAAFLIALKPVPAMFIAHCPRCAVWASRSIRPLGYCLACAPERFLVRGGEEVEKTTADTEDQSEKDPLNALKKLFRRVPAPSDEWDKTRE